MRISTQTPVSVCAICERTLLTGERPTRFAPDLAVDLVDVCPLCVEIAIEHGWIREAVIPGAWDIAWSQSRVTCDSIQPVRLAERGDEPEELDLAFRRWNASLDEEGRIVPDFARA